MTRQTRWAVGAGVLLFGLCLLTGTSVSTAADDKIPDDVKDAILKIADLIEKGKTDEAKKEAEALVKKKEYDGGKVGGLAEPMRIFKPKTKGGLGIGSKGDGIEATIISLGKGTKPKLSMDDIKKAAYITLAVTEITHAATPKKDDGKKKVKEWEKWTKDMQGVATDLAKETSEKKPDLKKVSASAKNLDGTCSECHQVFRPAS
jgi:hypothetical protein